jgi:cobyrinic acid a,c-diamide synthase
MGIFALPAQQTRVVEGVLGLFDAHSSQRLGEVAIGVDATQVLDNSVVLDSDSPGVVDQSVDGDQGHAASLVRCARTRIS